jgi:hypothetical protein
LVIAGATPEPSKVPVRSDPRPEVDQGMAERTAKDSELEFDVLTRYAMIEHFDTGTGPINTGRR